MTANTSDQDVVQQIRGTTATRDAALKSFFQDKALRTIVVQYALANGGSEHDGKDLFQDTVVLFDRNIRADKFNGQSSLRTYFVSIAKWHWVNLRRKKHNYHEELPQNIQWNTEDGPEILYLEEERKTILDRALATVGGRCVGLLNLYKLSYSMDEIAQNMGLSSADMAKKEVYRCRERLRNYLQSQPEILNTLR